MKIFISENNKNKQEKIEEWTCNNYNNWTLTKHSLPPKPDFYGDQYLITIINNQVVPVTYVQAKVRNKIIYRWEWMNRICPWEVIAWMPFPKPYKEITK